MFDQVRLRSVSKDSEVPLGGPFDGGIDGGLDDLMPDPEARIQTAYQRFCSGFKNELPMSWSHVCNIAVVSDTSSMSQNCVI